MTITKKVKRKSRHKPSMARGRKTRTIVRTVRRGGRRARGMLGGMGGMLKPAAAGIGGGMLAQEIARRAFPQAAPIAGYAGAWALGGTKGLIAKVVYDAITGQGGLLSGLMGNGGNGNGGSL